MGTIAQKLEYLNDTRLLLKDNINKINNVLDDNSTFRSYPQELFNGYLDILNNGTDTLWNNLEKVSQTGTEAVLEGVETAPMKMVLNGNTSQETTTGKNLLGLTNGTYSHNGITAVVNDGTITITGTATANSFVNIPLLKDIVLSNEQVTVSINNATTISDTATEFRVYESGNNYIPVQFTTIDRKTTTTKSGTFVSAYVRTTSGVNYGSGLVIKPQLELGSSATSYEPYTGGQPSPSPDYPQEVKVVKGENVVSVSGKNLFDVSKLENASWNYPNAPTRLVMFLDKANQGTKMSVTNLDTTTYRFSVGFAKLGYASQTNTIVNESGWATNSTYTITANNDGYPFLQISRLDNADISASEVEDKFQFEYSDTASEYTPFSKTDYPISLGTLELCKIGDYKDYLFKRNGKWYKYKAINKIMRYTPGH